MAVNFIFASRTSNQLRYRVTSAGAEAGDIDSAQLVADATIGGVPSDLANLLGTPVANQAFARVLAFNSTKMSIEFPSPTQDVDAAWVIDANSFGGFLRLTCTASGPDAMGSYLIITYRHSLIR
jgi:hypothetical protein